MCDCINKINEKLKERNTELIVALSLSNKSDTVVISTGKVDSKKRGKPINMLPAYCPFCGRKYNA
jgi:hypothetical protein